MSRGTFKVACDERAEIKFQKPFAMFAAGAIPGGKAPWIMADGLPLFVNEQELNEIYSAKEAAQTQRGLQANMKYADANARLPLSAGDPMLTIEVWGLI